MSARRQWCASASFSLLAGIYMLASRAYGHVTSTITPFEVASRQAMPNIAGRARRAALTSHDTG